MKGARIVSGKVFLEAGIHIDNIFEIISACTSVESVTYKGKTYYNKECNKDKDMMEECDKTVCSIIPSNNDDVVYNCIWEDNSRSYDGYMKLLDYLDGYDIDEIFIEKYHRLRIENISGYNHDHRGCNHCPLHLAQYDSVTVPSPVGLDDLIQIFYKLKSHKFERSYEMFCGCESSKNTREGLIVAKLNFDHGS